MLHRLGLVIGFLMLGAPIGGLTAAMAQGLEAPEAELPQFGQDLPKDLKGFDKSRFGDRPEDTAYGAFQRGLYKTAFNLALPNAEKDDLPSILLVAEIYARGLGQRRNPEKAIEWYKKASDLGDAEGQLQTALHQLQILKKGAPTDAIKALLKKSVEGGNALAAFNLGQLLIDENAGSVGIERAAPYFELAAKAGLADAQFAMGQIMSVGYGTVLPNEVVARAWYKLAAEQGHDTAQVEYATWLVEGRGGTRDYDAGFLWMQRVARLGNVAAQVRLARLYRNGIGVEGNAVLAAAWYIKARRAGLKDVRLDVFLEGLDDDIRAKALSEANTL